MRTLRKLGVALASVMLAAALATGAQQPSSHVACSLSVQITDEDGTVIPQAFVYVHSRDGTSQQLALDRNGKSKISLRSRRYDLFVSASGFAPQAQAVDLRSCKPIDLYVTMIVEPEHSDGPI